MKSREKVEKSVEKSPAAKKTLGERRVGGGQEGRSSSVAVKWRE